MAHSLFEIDTFVDAPPATVREILAVADNQRKLEHFPGSLQLMQTSSDPSGTTIEHYRISEQRKRGPITIQSTMRVEMSLKPTGEIVFDTYRTPGTHIHTIMWCLKEGQGTRLRDMVEIYAPTLLIQSIHQQAMQRHKRVFENLKQMLKAANAPT